MRPHVWKLVGGAVIATAVAVVLVGRTHRVAGQPTEGSGSGSGSQAIPQDVDPHQPFTPYALPGGIAYADEPAAERADLDQIKTRLDQGQPAASVNAFANAVDQAGEDADAQIAARQLGLVGVEGQGVVP